MAERSWQTSGADFRFGLGGLDLHHVIDAIPLGRYARLKNARRTVAGGVTARPGQARLAAVEGVAAQVHSIVRLEDPQQGTFVRVVGVDAGLWVGQTQLQLRASGFSGDPLALVPYRPSQSSETWVYVGDRAKMVKVRRDGLVLPVGIAAPTVAAGAFADVSRVRVIDHFESGWTGDAGTASAAVWTTVTGVFGNALEVEITPGTAAAYAFAEKALGSALDLSHVGVGADEVDATDDDLMNLWIWLSDAQALGEIRLYLVSGAFTGSEGVLPGAPDSTNVNGFVAVVRPDAENQADAPAAAFPDAFLPAGVTLPPGAGHWRELGRVGRPLRRGDFQRFGAGDWSDIVGVVVAVGTSGTTPIIVTFDRWQLRGGGGADTTDPAVVGYDYRYTHYDLRTGDESNGSPVQVVATDAMREPVRVEVTAAGDPNIRQRVYRRGGTLPEQWWFVGETSADGAEFRDDVSDDQAQGSGLALPDDHDEPVTTVDRLGNAVRGVPLRSIWGPVAGLYLMGCGDPYRRGHVYWSKAGEPGHWSPTSNLEVCSPTEELLAGLMYRSQAFAFSRERLFELPLQGESAPTTFGAVPTPCGHGLAGPWAYAVGPEIYFVSRDGVYATSGGPEKLLSEDLAPLFARSADWLRDTLASQTLGGYGEGGFGLGGFGTLNNTQVTAPPPIDWTAESYLRLEVHENELWFSYLDVTGRIEVLTYSLVDQEWRWDLYAKPPRVIYSERYAPRASQLLMGSTNGVVYLHAGTSDDGEPIDGLVRTAARDQGAPRAEKLYGDLVLDAETRGVAVSLRSYLGPRAAFHTATSVVPTIPGQVLQASEVAALAGRDQTHHPHFLGGTHARALSLEVVWLTTATPPTIYGATVAYLIDPDRITQRPTDWTDAGIAGLKRIKGLVLEIDTGGVPVGYAIDADGQLQETFTVETATRQQVERTAAIEARLVRLRPTTATPHLRYGVEWLVEPLPLALATWESRPLDLGQFGWFTHFDSFVTLRSTAPVTFTLTLDGVEQVYTIPSTDGVDAKVYVPFAAWLTRLVSYRLESAIPFLVYREETFVRIAPWGAEAFVLLHPFGGQPTTPPARTEPGTIVVSGV